MEELISKGMNIVATNFPHIGFLFIVLGTIFVIVELFVRLTPKQEDDKWWAGMMDSYFGKLVRILMSFTPMKKK